MSGHAHTAEVKTPYTFAPGQRLGNEALVARMQSVCPQAMVDPSARDLCVMVPAVNLVAVVTALRDEADLSFDSLLDIVALDCSGLKGAPARYAAVYILKSQRHLHRLRLKVYAEGEEPALPTLVRVYPIADWLEREAWDMMGIRFSGHPNLKRLLTHRDFEGHPLRRDYPVARRQKLSSNDPMLDELTARLAAKGWKVLDPGIVEESA